MAISYNPNALLKSLKTTFGQNINVSTSMLLALCQEIKSESYNEVHPWVSQPPQMTEQLKGDDVQSTALTDTSITLTNKIYSAALDFYRQDLDDQQEGMLDSRVQGLAAVAGGIYDKHISDLILDGENSNYLGYDGYALYGGTHPARGSSGTTDNLLAGTGVTVAAITADVSTSMAAIQNVLGENGEPFVGSAALKYYAVVPPALAHNFRVVAGATVIGSGDTNLYKGAFEVISNPRLTSTDATDWYMFASAPGMYPLVFQKRDGIEFSSLDSAQDSDLAFAREVYRYKVRARHAFGIGYWQLTNKTINS